MPQLFMWGLSISKAPPSLKCDSLVTGKNTGYLSRGTNERFPTFCDIKDLRAEFPSRKTGSLRKRSSELISPIRVVSPTDQGKTAGCVTDRDRGSPYLPRRRQGWMRSWH